MLRDLMRDVTAELEHIEAAVTESDRAAVAAAAHRIKNSAHMIGAHRLADAAAQLSSGGGGAVDEPTVAALRDQWSATRSDIEAEVAAHI